MHLFRICEPAQLETFAVFCLFCIFLTMEIAIWARFQPHLYHNYKNAFNEAPKDEI